METLKQVDFANIKLAFSHVSTGQLWTRLIMLKSLELPFMVPLLVRFFKVAFALRMPIKPLIKHAVFDLFCGGESCEDALIMAQTHLHPKKVGAILDFGMEGKDSEISFRRTHDETLKNLTLAAENRDLFPFCVMKFTGICSFHLLERVSMKAELSAEENRRWEEAVTKFTEICARAYALKVPLMVDAEESWLQPAIDRICTKMMAQFNRERPLIFNTLQLYRIDRLDYLQRMLQASADEGYKIGVKLVRGAYLEKERLRAQSLGSDSPVYSSKSETDDAFDAAVDICLQNIDKVALCLGTHNHQSVEFCLQKMPMNHIPRNHPHLVFSQLLGMGDLLSFNLADAGYNVAKYVPYGPVQELIPYLIRRMEENSGVRNQTGEELLRLQKELKRRSL